MSQRLINDDAREKLYVSFVDFSSAYDKSIETTYVNTSKDIRVWDCDAWCYSWDISGHPKCHEHSCVLCCYRR